MNFSQGGNDPALSGEPTVTALAQTAENVASRIARLNGVEPSLAAVADGALAWREHAELRELEEDLARLSAGLPLAEYGDRVASDVRDARSSLLQVLSVQDSVEALSNGLTAVSTTFDSAALRPFAALLRRFLRALVRDQSFHGITAEHQRIRGGSNLLRLAIGDGGPSAELLLSEGQLGEVSLAAILTASCLYPWSRWPALLLDDPMQYHDLVHSTAFFETLRNLVMFRGMQAIVSMHDAEQASYFRRKLESCAVPCVECEYVASGEEGTIVRTLER
jgi:exonuclease SbcC